MANDSSSKESTDNSSKSNTNWFGFGGESKGTKTAREDFNQCGDMVGVMKRSGLNFFTKSAREVSKDGKRSVTAS